MTCPCAATPGPGGAPEGAVFISGATGYLGRRLLDELDSSRFSRVLLLVRSAERVPAPLRDRGDVDVVIGDLMDPKPWQSRLAGVTTVAHLAAVTGKARPHVYTAVNVGGTANLLRAAQEEGVSRFLYVSSIAVTFSEKPRYFYAESKRAAEDMVVHSGLDFTIVRPTMIFGPEAPVLRGLVRLSCGFFMLVFGKGNVPVQPIDVRDVAKALWELIESERYTGETIEIGGPETLSIEALMSRIRRATSGRRPRTLHLPLRPIRRMLCMLEPALLPILPLTAGQFATFANVGTARPNELNSTRTSAMRSLETVLAEALEHV